MGAPEPQVAAEGAGRQHAQPHGLAVQVGAVAAEGFNAVAEGMAVVEDRPQAPFPFVGGHHPGFGGGGAF